MEFYYVCFGRSTDGIYLLFRSIMATNITIHNYRECYANGYSFENRDHIVRYAGKQDRLSLINSITLYKFCSDTIISLHTEK